MTFLYQVFGATGSDIDDMVIRDFAVELRRQRYFHSPPLLAAAWISQYGVVRCTSMVTRFDIGESARGDQPEVLNHRSNEWIAISLLGDLTPILLQLFMACVNSRPLLVQMPAC